MLQHAGRASTDPGVERFVNVIMEAVVTPLQDTAHAHQAGWGPPAVRRTVSPKSHCPDNDYIPCEFLFL